MIILLIILIKICLILVLRHPLDLFMDRIGRKRIIYDRDGVNPYMIRYYLWRKPSEGKSYKNLFFHKILRSDSDEHLHSHPWNWSSFILWGFYKEELVSGKIKIWLPLSFRIRKAEFYHRLTLKKPVYSLFWHDVRKRDWDFLVDGEKVNWEKYLRERKL